MQDVLLVLAEVPLFNARSSDAFLRARAETLAYTYSSGTNKLSKVTVSGIQKSYAYNADGTMKTDGLRGPVNFDIYYYTPINERVLFNKRYIWYKGMRFKRIR